MHKEAVGSTDCGGGGSGEGEGNREVYPGAPQGENVAQR